MFGSARDLCDVHKTFDEDGPNLAAHSLRPRRRPALVIHHKARSRNPTLIQAPVPHVREPIPGQLRGGGQIDAVRLAHLRLVLGFDGFADVNEGARGLHAFGDAAAALEPHDLDDGQDAELVGFDERQVRREDGVSLQAGGLGQLGSSDDFDFTFESVLR